MEAWKHHVMTVLGTLFADDNGSKLLTQFSMGEYCLLLTPTGEVKFRHYPNDKNKYNAEQDTLEKQFCKLLDDDMLMLIQDKVIQDYQAETPNEMIKGFMEDILVNRAIANYVKNKCMNCTKNICT